MDSGAGDTRIEEPSDKRALIDLIRSRKAVLFAGAGCSIPAGYPSWTKLLEELEELCEQCGEGFAKDARRREQEPLTYADAIKTHIVRATGDLERYYKFLMKRFGEPPRLTQFHLDLVALPFCGFATTNYDSVLETALLDPEPKWVDKSLVIGQDAPYREHEFRASLIGQSAPRLVAHLHGYYRWPSGMILSADDYARAYGVETTPRENDIRATRRRLGDFLRSILDTWPLVFIGFSLADPYLIAFLEAASDAFQLWGDKNHFAILDTTHLDLPSNTVRGSALREQYGVQALFYETDGTSYQALYDLISEIRGEVVGAPRSPLLEDVNSQMAAEMRT